MTTEAPRTCWNCRIAVRVCRSWGDSISCAWHPGATRPFWLPSGAQHAMVHMMRREEATPCEAFQPRENPDEWS